MNILPQPQNIQLKEGSFIICRTTRIVLDKNCGDDELRSALLLKEEIYQSIGLTLEIVKTIKALCNNAIFVCREFHDTRSYHIEISNTHIMISADSSREVFYAIQTLRQLIRTEGNAIPCAVIHDKSDYSYRGFYHDVTRGKVPKIETLKDLADRLSFYKINQMQLYIEHTFAYGNQSEVWMESDPLTAEEILILDEYCRQRYIELVPSIATFGHLYHALRSKSFRHLCELQMDEKRPFSWIDRMRHHTLDVSNPESFQFVALMIDEVMPLFHSDKFNIGCDETFDLGMGKSKSLADKYGKGKLYVDFLNKITEYVKKHGKKVMIWGDIILKYPEYIEQIPKDVICLNWEYAADVDMDKIEKIAGFGLQQYVCSGVTGWNRFINDMDNACMNIKNMVNYGMIHNAIGVLNTDWGDFGHINLLSSSIPGMIYGADLSWNWNSKDDISVSDDKISRVEFGDKSGSLVGLLRQLSRCSFLNWEHVVLWYEYHTFRFHIEKYHEIKVEIQTWKEEDIINAIHCSEEIENKLQKLAQSVLTARRQDVEEYIICNRALILFNSLALLIKKFEFHEEVNNLNLCPNDLAVALEYWFSDYCRIWRLRNKESELFRIKHTIIGICKALRDFDQKEKT